jgi:hypothetical protein
VVREQLLQRQCPAVLIVMPGILGFVATAIALPLHVVMLVLMALCRTTPHK